MRALPRSLRVGALVGVAALIAVGTIQVGAQSPAGPDIQKAVDAAFAKYQMLVMCRECGEGSLGVARFCEWCGTNIQRGTGQNVIHRCPYDSARVIACLCSSGDHRNASDTVLTLNVQGRQLNSQVSLDSVIEEIYVTAGQLVFLGTPLYRFLRQA